MAEVDSSISFEKGRKCKQCGERIPDKAHKRTVFCGKKCRDKHSWVSAGKRKKEQRRIDIAIRNASKECVTCGGPIPVDPSGRKKYCSAKCRWTKPGTKERKRKEKAARRASLGEEEFKRRNAAYMRKLRKDNKQYAERQRKAQYAWKVKRPDLLAEQRRREYAKKNRKDAHVKCWKQHQKLIKMKHDAHVKEFYEWARGQSAGWWMRHLKRTSGELWRNPKITDAAQYRIKYKLSTEFRLSEINRSTWRKEKLKARDDGTINFHALARERNTCVYCGEVMTEDMKCLDHIDPLSKGGENSINNVIVVCKPCNLKKRDKDFEEWVAMIPNNRQRAAMMMYRKKKGREPGQNPLPLVFA